jgi:hypothetical protein
VRRYWRTHPRRKRRAEDHFRNTPLWFCSREQGAVYDLSWPAMQVFFGIKEGEKIAL